MVAKYTMEYKTQKLTNGVKASLKAQVSCFTVSRRVNVTLAVSKAKHTQDKCLWWTYIHTCMYVCIHTHTSDYLDTLHYYQNLVTLDYMCKLYGCDLKVLVTRLTFC